MPKASRKGARLVALFLFGCLLFNFPFLTLFNVRGTLLGVPVIYAYLFVAWVLLVALVWAIVERSD
ncbi:hypothetical protein DSM104440_01219 [Usitatibacter palustris]|uniref:DUF3311 domain-containing protein n=2 Tax=Usitatibacter palustris TaxID=2732487 RepID=A0A6M4H6X6_9PROT|nr:hypothetical protein DSM104440_01219 [Usitatibacter palustris]